jgi:hypothetical protein
LVKRYYRELGSDAVQALFGRTAPRACAILGVVQVVSTLARKLRAGEIPADRFVGLLAAFLEDGVDGARVGARH